MKFLSPRLAAWAAIASIACVLSTPAQGHGQDASSNSVNSQTETTEDFESLTNGHKGHHHHLKPHGHHGKVHHHPKPKPKPKYSLRQLNLVCDGIIIDKIICKRRIWPRLMLEDAMATEETSTLEDSMIADDPSVIAAQDTFSAENNGGKIKQEYIVMDSPCSKDLPEKCKIMPLNSVEESNEDMPDSEDVEDTDESEGAEDDVADEDDEVNEDGFESENHGRKKPHKKHPRHGHGRPNTHGNHGQHGHGHQHHKHKHPWKDRCVAVGEFCGNKLYGCKFHATTLYKCKAIGDFPVPIKIDTKTCGGDNGDEKCTCPGPGTGPVCGYELPAVCKANPHNIYVCRGGKGSKPEVLAICRPGTQCQPRPLPVGAICGASTCDCHGSDELCSDAFPDKCKLVKNAIHKCTESGKPELVKKCENGQVCVTISDGAICTNNDCKCPTDGTVCGEVFPITCKIKATALYTCIKGQDPVFAKDCYPDRCSASKASFAAAAVFEATAMDQCTDKCTCSGSGTVCGSTFPPECKLPASNLYKCDGNGKTPVLVKSCTEGGCTVNAGDDSCSTDPCTCPGLGFAPVCGSDLPSVCNADPNTIYHCRGGSGTKPEVLSICKPGTQCIKRPPPVGAICGSTTCDCTGDDEVCSESFPGECNLVPNSIYKCTSSGKPELVKTCDDVQACISVSDGTICANTDCKCPDDGTVCGEVFPLYCKLKTTALYTCTKGSDPVLQKDCYPDRCKASVASLSAAAVFEATATDQCTDSCKCVKDGKVCGSTFPPKCDLLASTLYTCSGAGATPTPAEKCDHGCVVHAGEDACSTNTCTCPGPGTGPVCGYELPSSCNASPNNVYVCRGGKGSIPEVLAICKPGTQCQPKPLPLGAICGSSTCDCTGSGEVCSNIFPGECNVVPNSVYKCTESGKPELVKTCDTAEACVTISDGSVCTNNDCKCPDDGTVCGEVFPITCKIKATALYTCIKGQDPVFAKDCYPDRCSASKASFAAAAVFEATAMDQCTDKCTCSGSGTVCGSTFPPECKLPASNLYKCDGNGKTPVLVKSCTEGGCTVNAGDDSCSTDPCTCPGLGFAPVCGSELPAECKADPNTIYYCPGGSGTKPEVLEICKPGTICTKKPLPVGAICGSGTCDCTGDNEVCSESFPGECNLVPNSVYKCTSSGTPELIKTCDSTEACVSVADGSICTNTDCKCPADGTICGEVFPLYCKLKTTALYTCTKGADPVLFKDCYPERCQASVASLSAAAVFEATAMDQCTDSCKCIEEGKVCGSTFPPKCGLLPSSLYTCSGNGATPVEAEKCGAGGCTVNAGDDSCSTNDCTCPGDGTTPVCSSLLPASCNAKPNTIYQCPGGAGTAPEVLAICDPGTLCQPKPPPVGAVCGSSTCDCTGSGEVCSNIFPGECNVVPNSIYKCTESGTPELIKTCDTTEACVSVADGSICIVPDCKCPDDGTICGEIFPLSCKLKTTALYTCVKGQDPVLSKDCDPQRCSASLASLSALSAVFEAELANDKCTDPCLCQGTGKVCGSTFLPECNKDPSTIYICNGEGTVPVADQKCPDGQCVVNAGDDSCGVTPSDCTCPNDAPVCGWALLEVCRGEVEINPNAIYTCPGGTGTTPEVAKICLPGTTCQAKPYPVGAACGGTTCECSGSGEVCSDVFPGDCSLKPNSIYRCTESGVPELVKTCEAGQACITVSDGSLCVSDDCKCTRDGEVCGESFPQSCGLKATAIYTCVTGQAPVFKSDCYPDRCSATKAAIEGVFATADTCINSCLCTGVDPAICGSTFPPTCGLQAAAIYKCDAAGQPPSLVEVCTTGICVVNAGDDKCDEGNACKCIDSDDVCGSQFPGQCNLSLGGLYSCAGAGSDPVLVEVCPLGVCIVQLGSDKCGPNPCDCKDGTAACGSTFPPECLRDPATIYNCPGGEGTAPVPGEKCQSGVCIVVNTGDDVCLPVPSTSIAPPTSAGPTSAGPTSAGPTSAGPTSAGPTSAGPTSAGPTSAAPTSIVPASNTASPTNAPTTTSESATPTPTPTCVCSGSTKVCGSALPANCGFNVTSLYTCNGAGLAPVTPVNCPAGCNTTTTPDHTCNPDCLAQVTAVNTAIDAITAAINPILNSTPVTTAAFGPVLTLFNQIKTNLTSVTPTPTALAPIAGAANETLAGVIKLFQQVQAIIPSPVNTTLQPALDALNNLLPLLQALINCAGGTKDCSGLRTLFTEISNNVITLLQGVPAASQYATLLQNVTAVVLNTTASSDLTALNRAGADMFTIIDALTGNATFVPALGQAAKVVSETAKILLICEGVNITIFSDKCAAFRAKVEGYLSDFINFVKGILGSIPIIGPLISDPLLQALNALVVDLQMGSATAIGGVLSIFQAIISILGILPADDTTNSIRDYLLNLVGIMNVPPECQEPANCSGLIKIVTIIGQGAVTLISSVFPSPFGDAIKAALAPAMQGLIDALGGGSTAVIQTAYDILNPVVQLAESLFPAAARPFRIFLDGCKAILDCLNNGTSNTMVTRSGVSISANPIPTSIPIPTGIPLL